MEFIPASSNVSTHRESKLILGSDQLLHEGQMRSVTQAAMKLALLLICMINLRKLMALLQACL